VGGSKVLRSIQKIHDKNLKRHNVKSACANVFSSKLLVRLYVGMRLWDSTGLPQIWDAQKGVSPNGICNISECSKT